MLSALIYKVLLKNNTEGKNIKFDKQKFTKKVLSNSDNFFRFFVFIFIKP